MRTISVLTFVIAFAFVLNGEASTPVMNDKPAEPGVAGVFNRKSPDEERRDRMKLLARLIGDEWPGPELQLTDVEKWRLARVQKQLCARFKDEGGISDPTLPFIFYVNRVEGKKLFGVEFMRRAVSGKGFDVIGRAEEMELRVDVPRRQLLAEMRVLRIRHSSGIRLSLDRKTWRLDLPADFGFLKAESTKLLKKAELPLSPEDRKFLAEGKPKLDIRLEELTPTSPAAPAPAP